MEAPATKDLKISACRPLFYLAFELRGAGACLHSHSINAVMATLVFSGSEYTVTQLEMMKGLEGHGYYDTLTIPIIENTAHEAELEASMREAMLKYPGSPAVLVRRHGVYVWGSDWVQAKTQAECLDFLFQASVAMKQLGIANPAAP
ncbi:putative methylthioribulose-1-phosphate dehydratase [Porphyridium purpureum]|uniref:Putative methylthioribulose-1-phosphate dehydratase n=1 Tax=Porphyridium purpureum TaxID=35688 RepID=A0A5J4YWH7_PORPP|nr:putative methylthioribulose-1-phosphate dehydratase [Porphyridium purpureum]|eukprot:POR5462..scf209_3